VSGQVIGSAHTHTPPRVGAKGIKRRLVRELVAQAPPDLEQVNAQIPLMSGWLRVLLIVGGGAGSWAAILGVAHLLS
jgi:hypothetical protein